MNEEDGKAAGTMKENSQGRIGYACLYPGDGGERDKIGFGMMPEKMEQFTGEHAHDAEKIIPTDMRGHRKEYAGSLDSHAVKDIDHAIAVSFGLDKLLYPSGNTEEDADEEAT